MPVVSTDCGCSDCAADHCATKFMTSPVMGTYQPTFIIHDMDFLSDTYTRKGHNYSLLSNQLT